MLEATAEAIQTQMIKKGEVLQVARVADYRRKTNV